MADLKVAQLLVKRELLLIIRVPLRVGLCRLAVADEAGGKGCPVLFAGRGGKTEDRAAERTGLVGQRGPNFSAQNIRLDLPPDG